MPIEFISDPSFGESGNCVCESGWLKWPDLLVTEMPRITTPMTNTNSKHNLTPTFEITEDDKHNKQRQDTFETALIIPLFFNVPGPHLRSLEAGRRIQIQMQRQLSQMNTAQLSQMKDQIQSHRRMFRQ